MRESIYSIHRTICLANTLFKSDLKSKYRESFLGYAWTLAPALFLTFSFYLASESNVLNAADLPLPYPVYAFSGAIFWQLFAESILLFTQGMAKSKLLMLKLKVDTNAVILSKFYEVIFDFGLKLVILFILMAVYGVGFKLHLAFLPIGFFVILLLGVSVALVVSPLALLVQDLNRILPHILNFGMFLTPIFYSTPPYGFLSKIVALNPMTHAVNFNRALMTGNLEFGSGFLISAVLFILFLPLSFRLHRVSIPIVIERLGN